METTTKEEQVTTTSPITENMVRISLLFIHNIEWNGMTPEQSVEDISSNLGISKQSVLHCVKMVQS